MMMDKWDWAMIIRRQKKQRREAEAKIMSRSRFEAESFLRRHPDIDASLFPRILDIYVEAYRVGHWPFQ